MQRSDTIDYQLQQRRNRRKARKAAARRAGGSNRKKPRLRAVRRLLIAYERCLEGGNVMRAGWLKKRVEFVRNLVGAF